jgi:hypothetical protein
VCEFRFEGLQGGEGLRVGGDRFEVAQVLKELANVLGGLLETA